MNRNRLRIFYYFLKQWIGDILNKVKSLPTKYLLNLIRNLVGIKMFYEVPENLQANRHFAQEIGYNQIDWKNLNVVIDAFQQKINDWYLKPAKELNKNGHFAFAIMAINCIIIDMLSQFRYGKLKGTSKCFTDFIKEWLPDKYSERLTTPIRHNKGGTDVKQLNDVADVIYHGFRCGILHQAHVLPYGGVNPGEHETVQICDRGHVVYKDGSDCPLVVIYPQKMLHILIDVFEKYLQQLKNPDRRYNTLRENFKKKFTYSFGVDITSAVQ